MERISKRIMKGLMAIMMAVLHSYAALAAAPTLHSQPAYQSPVRGEPDDLLLIPGYGFAAGDIVVYQAITDTTQQLIPPASIPTNSTAIEGVAPIVSVANAPYSLTVRLPDIQNDRSYALWVRNSQGEWSNGVKFNDARPLWLTPSYVYATAQVANLPRYLKVVGRNLQPAPGAITQVRLSGPSSVTLIATNDGNASTAIEHYVAKIDLPPNLPVGEYTVEVSRDGESWVRLTGQTLTVKADPTAPVEFAVSSYGGCVANDALDDTACVVNAVNAAKNNPGGGTVVFGPGIWQLINGTAVGVNNPHGIILPMGVNLRGAGAGITTVARDAGWVPQATFTLQGGNTISDIRFEDHRIYTTTSSGYAMLYLGKKWWQLGVGDSTLIQDVVITRNVFDKPLSAIATGGLPIERLMVTYNEFGAYNVGVWIGGDGNNLTYRMRIDDSVILHNTFKPGSYYDVAIAQGSIASQLGTSRRLDFSNNVADGASTDYLYDPQQDIKGWRAAFFWSLRNNEEMLLVSQNNTTCTGDRAGDGEAISYDNNHNTVAFDKAQAVIEASADTVTVVGPLKESQNNKIVPADYYNGHWVQIAEGPGMGQVRRVVSYVNDTPSSRVTFTVSPAWDIVPQASSRITVAMQFWQVYTVDNFVDHRTIDDNGAPLCHNSKTRNGTNSPAVTAGVIGFWAQTADSAIEGNRQYSTSGILFQQSYSAAGDPACTGCGAWTSYQSFLEVRNNLLDREFRWESGCSWAGLWGSYSSSPTPTSPPPVAGYGVSIARNTVIQSDALRGGAISLSRGWHGGASPYNWKIVNNTLIHHNVIRDMVLPAPTAGCDVAQNTRIGINLWDVPEVLDSGAPEYYQYRSKIWRTVLYGNTCGNVATPLKDGGIDTSLNFKATSTIRHCPSGMVANSCECLDTSQANVALTTETIPATLPVGGTVTYTVRVTNNGPSSATAVLLAMEPGQSVNITGYSPSQGTCDSVSRSCALGTLANGAMATVTITGTATALGVSTSTFSVTQKEPDSSAADSGASVAISVAEADLVVTVSDTPDPALTGSPLSYTITATNAGPSDATNAVVTHTLPAGVTGSGVPSQGSCTGSGVISCNLGMLNNGQSATVTVTATPGSEALFDPTSSSTFNVNVSASTTVSATEPDPVTANNAATTITNVRLACLGKVVTKRGTSGNDGTSSKRFAGGSGADVIHTLSGADWIDGKGGNDTICGGSGNDNVNGSGGADALSGGLGTDTCNGGNGNDTTDGSCETVNSIP